MADTGIDDSNGSGEEKGKDETRGLVLKNTLSSLEEIDESLHGAYVPGEDGSGNTVYLLQTEDNVGLKTALDRERSNAQTLAAKLESFKKANVTVERFRQLESENRVLRDQSQKGSSDLEAVKSEMATHYDEKISELQANRDILLRALNDHVVVNSARQAIMQEKGNPHLLTDIVCKSLKMKEMPNGQFVAVVVNADGQERMGDMHGNPMTVEQFVRELKKKDEYATAFAGKKISGTDLSPSPDSGGGKKIEGDPMSRMIQYRRSQGTS